MGRIEGLDIARTLAFIGMVVVNFKTVLQVEEGSGLLYRTTSLLEGKAAASFVVLAGLGLALSLQKVSRYQILKRALFLLIVGTANSLVFPADIIHYYAFYFLIGAFLIHLPFTPLVVLTLVVNFVFVALLLTLHYDQGWHWPTLEYQDYWSAAGFVRNLLFNGFHPLFPWLGFLLIGGAIAKLKLDQARVQYGLILVGLILVLTAQWATSWLLQTYVHLDAELAQVFTTGPMPPTPLYTATGTGAALVLIGVCLRLGPGLKQAGVLQYLTPMGRQTLSWYIAHIFLGMGTMEVLGMFDAPQSLAVACWAAALFCGLGMVSAYLWSKLFKQGPVEMVMRYATR